jgi:hypothetical protein
MGQGFKVYSSSELYCKWPKVAETMTEARMASVIVSVTYDYLCQIRAHSPGPQQAKPWGHRRRQANGFSFIETVRHWVC